MPYATTFHAIFIIMALVYKEPVNAKLLKGHYIVFPCCVIELFKLLITQASIICL